MGISVIQQKSEAATEDERADFGAKQAPRLTYQSNNRDREGYRGRFGMTN